MEDRISRLESEIRELARSVRLIEGRIAALEGTGAGAPELAAGAVPQEAEKAPAAAAGWADTSGMLTLAGRLLIVMGGAYLLRALTEASAVSPGLGVSLGLAYAVVWVVASGRAAARGRLWSGTFHGVAASLVAFPILWEAATRFRILRAPLDVLLLAGVAAAFIGVACVTRFQPLAWFATVGSLATAAVLMISLASFVPYAAFLIALGVATLWLGYELEWRGLRWPVAAFANLAVLGLTVRALASEPKESPAAALTIQLLLLGLYYSTVAIRTLFINRNVIPFEVVQMIAAFLLGFVGAVYTTRATGYGAFFLGIAGLVLGATFYAVAFAFVDRHEGRSRNFYFYTSLGLLFTLTGNGLVLSGIPLSLAWVGLAVAAAFLGWRFARVALVFHSAVSLVAAAFATGLVAYAYASLAGPANLAGYYPSLAQLLVLAGAAVCIAFPPPAHQDMPAIWSRIQRLVITVILVAGLGAIIDSFAGRAWAGLPAGGVDPGILATVRTLVMSASALALAWMGRHDRFEEWGWLVYPVLGLTGVKLLFEDFAVSRYATLFLALAAYGGALIVSPRLRR